MLVTNHVLSGAVVGATTRRPVHAFVLGVASHFVLDWVPHWGKCGGGRRMLQVAVPDGLIGLAVMGTMAAVAPRERRAAVLAGMAGAAFADLDKPSRVFFGRSPFPPAVDRFHSAIQHEKARRAHYEATAAVVFGSVALSILLRRATRQ